MEYSKRLYRICSLPNTVDNSEKTDDLYIRMWITVWTVWKCMRIYTVYKRNEYARIDHSSQKTAWRGELCDRIRKRSMHAVQNRMHDGRILHFSRGNDILRTFERKTRETICRFVVDLHTLRLLRRPAAGCDPCAFRHAVRNGGSGSHYRTADRGSDADPCADAHAFPDAFAFSDALADARSAFYHDLGKRYAVDDRVRAHAGGL